MKRLGMAMLIGTLLLSVGCSKGATTASKEAAPQTTGATSPQTAPNAFERVMSQLKNQDVAALASQVGKEGLRVVNFATDGGDAVPGDQARAVLEALVRGAKPELVATSGSGDTFYLIVRGLNQGALPGTKLQGTELVQLSFVAESIDRSRSVAVVLDPNNLMLGEIRRSDRWVFYEAK